MAILRIQDIRAFTGEELEERAAKLRMELIHHYGKVGTGGSVETSGSIKEIRKTIARIMTEQNRRRTA